MKKIFILTVTLTFFCESCENLFERFYTIRVKNKSSQSISVYAKYILPDTSLADIKPTMHNVIPGKQAEIDDLEVNDEKFDHFKTNKLTFFILSTDTLAAYSWDTIKKYNKILKRYELDNQDLINMGGDIIYH